MSVVKSFTVGGTTYNVVMASAVKQDELVSLLTAPIMERAMGAARAGLPMDDGILVPMFMAMHHSVKQQVAAILLHQTAIVGGNALVSVDDFTGRMVEYNTLLVHILKFNLSDFFDWLSNAVAADRRPVAQAVAPA